MNVIKDCNVNIISLCLKWTTLLGDVNYTATLLCVTQPSLHFVFSNQLLFSFFYKYFLPQVLNKTDTVGLGISLPATNNTLKYFYCVFFEKYPVKVPS